MSEMDAEKGEVITGVRGEGENIYIYLGKIRGWKGLSTN